MDNAHKIIDNIWLGNVHAALDEKFLEDNNIKTVFNCTKNYPFHVSVRRQYRVPVDDSLQDEDIRNLELWSFEIVTKMMNEYKMGNTMLVHCAAGIQRSASSVAMFLMAAFKMSPDEAIQFIKERRPVAFKPAVNFDRSIRGFHASLEKMRMAPPSG
jgi:dual specificity phosphatase 12